MCASRKKLRLFCSCFPHHFFYCTSRPILRSAGFPERAGKRFNHCTCAKALGPSTSSAKTGWRRAGLFFSPVRLCGAVTLLAGCAVEMQVLQHLLLGMRLGHLHWVSSGTTDVQWLPCPAGLFLPLEKKNLQPVSYGPLITRKTLRY